MSAPRLRAALPAAWSRNTGEWILAGVSLSYIVATGLGVMMRLELLGWRTGVPFDHLLHAHSHTLFFGWAGLAVLLLAVRALPRLGRALRGTTVLLTLSIPGIFVGFLALGYHPVTIAISTVVMLTWYLAIWLWWREARGVEGIGLTIFRVAFAYLAVSSLGVWALAALQATGFGSSLTEGLAVHAFLLGFAWFLVLGVIGSITVHRPPGVHVDPRTLRRALHWWAPLAFLTFPLGVAGGPEFGWIGPVARLAGIALLYPGWLWTRAVWLGSDWKWKPIAVWFAVATTATALVAAVGTSALDLVGRQGVVAYLHALLLGFVTASLFGLLSEHLRTGVRHSHHVMLATMLLGLALVPTGLFMTGMWVAAVGGIGLWAVGVLWVHGLTRPGRSAPGHQPAR